jgi:multiple sugar transport system substrate-binding protein
MARLKVRAVLGLFAVVLCGFCLFAIPSCAKRDTSQTTEIHLLMNRHPFTESIHQFIEEYEQETGVKVNMMILSEEEYFEKLITELSSRSSYYDLFMLGFPHLWQYAKAGWLEPLDQYIEDPNLTPADWDPNDFFPELIACSRWNLKQGEGIGEGPLWALPVNEEAYVVFYRKDLFERFNVKPPATYQEMYEAAKALTRDVDGQRIYGFGHRGVRSWSTIHPGYMTALASWGARDFDEAMHCAIGSPQSIEITDLFMRTLKEAGPPGWPSYTWYEGKEAFLSGRLAMWFDANHQAAAFEDPNKSQVAGKVGYLLPPPGPDGQIRSSTWLWSLAMNSASKNKDAAWKFLAWATSKELLQRTVPYENINPTRKSVWQDPKTVEVTNWAQGEYRRTAEQLLSKYAKIRWTPSIYVTQAGDRWAAALQEIYAGGKTTEEALKDAAADIDRMVGKGL